MSRVYLSTGSNRGDRLKALLSAYKLIELRFGQVVDHSDVVETEPWGFESETDFLNQILVIETSIPPLRLLKIILETERKLGRIRGGKGYDSRIIDIDILLYDDEVVAADQLSIPHPLMHLRRFILEPLAGIAPDVVHPVFQKPINRLLAEVDDHSPVSIIVERNEFCKLLKSSKNGNPI